MQFSCFVQVTMQQTELVFIPTLHIMEKMTPERAIQIIDQAIAQVSATRETHSVLIEAVKTVKELLPTQETPQE